MNDLSNSLWITALGMGLVFGAILVLWLTMILLTRLTAEKESPLPNLPPQKVEDDETETAAAAAVAAALAEQELSAARPLTEPPTAIVSAWQLGMRTRLLTQKGSVRRR